MQSNADIALHIASLYEQAEGLRRELQERIRAITESVKARMLEANTYQIWLKRNLPGKDGYGKEITVSYAVYCDPKQGADSPFVLFRVASDPAFSRDIPESVTPETMRLDETLQILNELIIYDVAGKAETAQAISMPRPQEGLTLEGESVVGVEFRCYDTDGTPNEFGAFTRIHSVFTRNEAGRYTQWDFNFSRSRGCYYYRMAGTSDHIYVTGHYWAEEDANVEEGAKRILRFPSLEIDTATDIRDAAGRETYILWPEYD